MKKIIVMAAFASVLVSCNSGGDTTATSDEDSMSSNVTPGIQNVNGNIPDTTNAMGLSTSENTVQHGQDSLNDIAGDTTRKESNQKKK